MANEQTSFNLKKKKQPQTKKVKIYYSFKKIIHLMNVYILRLLKHLLTRCEEKDAILKDLKNR